MQVGKKDMYEVQTYYTQPDKDWIFDETRRDTYVNPEWQKQKLGKRVENEDELDKLLKKNGFLSAAEKRLAMEEAERKMMDGDDEPEEDLNDEDDELLGEAKPSRSLDKFMNDDAEDDDFGDDDFSVDKLFAEIKENDSKPAVEEPKELETNPEGLDLSDDDDLSDADLGLDDESLSETISAEAENVSNNNGEEVSAEPKELSEEKHEDIDHSKFSASFEEETYVESNDHSEVSSPTLTLMKDNSSNISGTLNLHLKPIKKVETVSRDDGFEDEVYADE